MKKKSRRLGSLAMALSLVLTLLPPLSLTARAAAPAVLSVAPSGTDTAVSGSIAVTFSKAMNTAAGTVSLDNGVGALSEGTWSNDNSVYTISYSSLLYSTTYTVSVSDFADASGDVMLPDAAHSFTTLSGGSGTTADPYIINNLADLENVTNNPSAYYKLNADITSTPLTAPLCSSGTPFTGNFNGNGHSVAVSITDSSTGYDGMFAYIGSTGYVSGLTVSGSVTGSADTSYVGGLAGYNAGEIYQCSSSVIVSAAGITKNYIGGLVGINYNKITYSGSTGTVTASGKAYIGGLVGCNYSMNNSGGTYTSMAVIDNCTAGATVSVSASGSNIGGLIGYNDPDSSTKLNTTTYNITNCSASGSVSETGGSSNVGGFVGYNQVFSISGCSASASVTGGNASSVGGFVGWLKGNGFLANCNSSGEVRDSNASGSNTYVGGFGGNLYSGEIDNCFATDNVNVSNCSGSGSLMPCIGGFIGYTASTVALNYCYSSGDISADTITSNFVFIGGFIGCAFSVVTASNIYSTSDITLSNLSVQPYTGGLIGYCYKTGITINNAYAEGSAGGSANGGGLLGYYQAGTFTNCYWNSSKNAKSAGNNLTLYGTGVSTANMTGTAPATSMSALDSTSSNPAWKTTANGSTSWYCPQLAAFYNNAATQTASIASVTLAVSTISVSPASVSVGKGATESFTASVSGDTLTSNSTFTWAVSGKQSSSTAISSSGVLTVGLDETSGSVTVTATSADDASICGSATVNVVSNSSFSGGSGTAADPFIISTQAQLEAVSNYPSACFELNADDLTLSAPLCSSSKPFTGNFNGKNKTITLSISDTSDTYVGLFAYIGSGASVTDLTVAGSATATLPGTSSTLYIGALAAYNAGTITNCVSDAAVSATNSNMNHIGGLIGYNVGSISGSSSSGDVTANSKANVGGLVGTNYSVDSQSGLTSAATIDSCHASGKVMAKVTGSNVGGLVGSNTTTTGDNLTSPAYVITNSYAAGNVTETPGGQFIGGLIGYNQTASVQNCYALGDVTATFNTCAGGLIGFNTTNGAFYGCHASGNVIGSSLSTATNLGGLVGKMNSGIITACYTTGNVLPSNISGGACYCAGLVGYMKTGTISLCYTSGKVTLTSVSGSSSQYGGGLIGWMKGGSVTNCYSTGDITGTNLTSTTFLGGLIACQGNGTITGAYAVGTVSGTGTGAKLGGFFGEYGNATMLTGCYWNSSDNANSAGSTTTNYGAGLTAYNMTGDNAATNMPALDFSTPVWVTKTNGTNAYYPQLYVFSGSSDSAVKADSLAGVTTSAVLDFAGTGISGDPYIITTLDQLKAAVNYPSAYYKLGADITGVTAPLFNSANPFTGNFDGSGNTITLSISDTSDTYVGLFGSIGTGAVINNLKLAGTVSATLTGNASTIYIGALAGYNAGTVSGCVSSVDVTATSSFMNHIGGLIGYNAGTISGSSASGTVTATGTANIGGLTGTNYSVNSSSDGGSLSSTAVISGCAATGAVTANTANSKVGGLVGANTTTYTNTLAAQVGTVVGSNASGAVSDTPGSGYAGGLIGYNQVVSVQNCYSTGIVSGTFNSNIGGFIGLSTGGATISDCHAKGTVTDPNISQDANNIGGFIGKLNSGMIQKSYETGDVSILSSSAPYCNIGGMVGLLYSGTIDSCFASGDITASNVTSQNYLNPYIGGFVGFVTASESDSAAITNSYASGDVTLTPILCGSNLGGFVGSNSNCSYTDDYALGSVKGGCGFMGGFGGSGTNHGYYVYWNNSKNGGGTGWQQSSTTGTGLTSDEMSGTEASDNMTHLDFTNVWTTKANDTSYSYAPQLKVFANSSDSTVAADSLSSVEIASDSTIKLNLAFNPLWNGTTATWGGAGEAGGYDITLYKGVDEIKEVSVGASKLNYDFSSDMADNGSGSYRFTVKTKGFVDRNTTYTGSEVSAPYSPYSYIAPLSTPENLRWDTGTPAKAMWDAVSSAVSYTVQLYKGGAACGDAVTGITNNYCDFTNVITEPGAYTFTVTAIGDGTNYSNSSVSDKSSSYVYTKTLSMPENLAWDTGTPAKAMWGAVSNVTSYTVQLYKGGTACDAVTGITNNYYDFTSVITEPGSYTFTVTAVGDGTYYLTGSASAQSAAYTKTETLATPENLKWDAATPTKAEWDAVSNASSYSVQLYKGGVISGDAIAGVNDNYCDLSSAITEPGSYTFTVTAAGDGTYYLTGNVSAQSAAYTKTETLATPGNLKWDTATPTKAEWDAVSNASSYTVQLYKGGNAFGDAVTITNNYYDFASETMDAGSYTFVVKAIGDESIYLDSAESSASGAYAKIATLATPENLKWDTATPTKAEWDAVSNATSYTVQLYNGGTKIGPAVTDKTDNFYDFTSVITEPGSYTFTVTAIGDGTYYLTGSASAQSGEYTKTETLSTPVNYKWDTGTPAKAEWDTVSNAVSYTVQLYKGGTACGDAVTEIANDYYDFSSATTEPGSYTFTVTAVGDGTYYLTGSASAQSGEYAKTETLLMPGNLKWDTGTPAKAEWDAVSSASSYTVQLYKGGDACGDAVTEIANNYYDFSSAITEPGAYTFTVTAVGDGTYYLTGSASSQSAAYTKTETLSTPGNCKWDTDTPAKATWGAVSNASSYTVQLYKGVTACGDAVTGITNNYYDFTSAITEPGSYTFTVTAVGDGTYYLAGSASAQSGEYTKTTTLSTPGNPKWDTGTPAKAEWDAVSSASSYTVQLYNGGVNVGDAVTGITGSCYDFTNSINNTGAYTFTVTAVGDGTYYLTGSASAASAAYGFTADSSISPVLAGFDKRAGSSGNTDIAISLSLKGNTLSGIYNGGSELTSGTDYLLAGNTVTISKDYLGSLDTGETALSIRFSAGNDQTLTISVTDSTAILLSITAPAAISGLANGTAKTTSALGLPSTVMLVTDKGDVSADVTWDVDACSYNSALTDAQTFEVSGSVTLPAYVVNTNNVDVKVSINVTVSQASISTPTGGGSSAATAYQATAKWSDGTTEKLNVSISGQSASVDVDAVEKSLISGGNKLEISIPTVSNATSYGIALSADSINSDSDGILAMHTALGSISVPTNMLSSLSGTSGQKAQITISEGDGSSLSSELQSKIGDRPVVQLSLSVGGSQTEWNNSNAPVTVSIPYTPTAEEKANPGSIVVWYIEANGGAVCIPSGHYDAKTGTVTFATTHFSTYAVGYNNMSFTDVAASAWYADYVTYLAARGIVGGNNGAYSPDVSITRAEFVTILARMSSDDLSGYKTSVFSDVATDSWYLAAVQWANKAGISSGYDGKFNPNETITREQMATMLYRYAEYKGTVSNTEGMSVREFSDYDSISSWAQAPIQWAMNNKILSGNTDGSFAPQSSATRAQAAKMLAILMQGTVK